METGLTYGLVIVTIVLVLLDAAVASAWMRFNRWRHGRFKYRLRIPGQEGTLWTLGTQGADGKITARGLELIDGMDRRVKVADGQTFTIETFRGGALGDDQQYRVPAGAHVWVLDYEPTVPEAAPALPSRPAPYVLTTAERPLPDEIPASGRFRLRILPFVAACVARLAEFRFAHDTIVFYVLIALGVVVAIVRLAQLTRVPSPPPDAPAPNEHGSVMLVSMPSPLWVQGLRKAQSWFLGAKPPDDSTVIIVAPFDPEHDDCDEPRTPMLGAMHHILAEAIETGTDVHARAVVPVFQTRSRRYLRRFAKKGYAGFVPWIHNYPGRRLLIWSAAEGDGFTLTMRATEPSDAPEHTMSGAVADLAPKLLAWLEREGWCKRTELPDGIAAAVPTEDAATWAKLLAVQERVALAKPENAILPVPEPSFVSRSLDDAIAFAERQGARLPQAFALAISMGIEVNKHGLLDDAHRARLRALVESLERGDEPLARMAPGMLTGIGEVEAGAAKARETLAARGGAMRGIADAYSEWLTEIAEKPDKLARRAS